MTSRVDVYMPLKGNMSVHIVAKLLTVLFIFHSSTWMVSFSLPKH